MSTSARSRASAEQLAERNEAGDWHEDSTLSDDRYNRPDGSIDISKRDPLDAILLFGRVPSSDDDR